MVNTGTLIPILLLTLFGGAIIGGTALVLLVIRWRRKHQPVPSRKIGVLERTWIFPALHDGRLHRPTSWLAIRSRNLSAVQAAFGLSNARPCTWAEALTGEQRLFVAPPINGWILVIGSDLPDPADDVDLCFRFLLELGQRLGQVQFFNANAAWNHHAWVRIEAGRVMRAYAWAGRTLWHQGIKTRAELALGLKCFHYFETPPQLSYRQLDVINANTEKVPLLAARWSLDPATIDERMFSQACGIAGVPSHLR